MKIWPGYVKASAVSDQLCFRWSRTWLCLRPECQGFNYCLCRRRPHQPHTSHDISCWNLFQVCKIKLRTCCLPPLLLPVWMLHLPGQSCSPTWCICMVLSEEGERRAEIKPPLKNTTWVFFPCLVSCFSLAGFPCCLSLEDLFCSWRPHQQAMSEREPSKAEHFWHTSCLPSVYRETSSGQEPSVSQVIFCWYLSDNKAVIN